MARTIGDLPSSNVLTPQDWLTLGFFETSIGGTGAVGTTVTGSMEGVALTRTGAGTYTVVYPAALVGAIIPYVAKSAAPTVFEVSVTARSLTAGTATIVFANAAGTATDPASGDVVGLFFALRSKIV